MQIRHADIKVRIPNYDDLPHIKIAQTLDILETNFPKHLHAFKDGSKFPSNLAGAAYYCSQTFFNISSTTRASRPN